MNQSVVIVAGGMLDTESLNDIQSHDYIIGVDRGAWWLIEHNIIPDYALGDFDSVTKEQKQLILKKISPNVAQYEVEKDETDLELALQYATTLHPGYITVYGAIGTRFDQSLAGIFLLEKFSQWNIAYKNKTNEIYLIKEGKIIRPSRFPYCSFLSLTEASVISLHNFKYPLEKGLLKRSQSLGISNEVLSPHGHISVHKGLILCIKSID